MLSWFPSANIRDIFYLDIGFQCTFEQLYKEYGEPETVPIIKTRS
jgi:hypothetical protein